MQRCYLAKRQAENYDEIPEHVFTEPRLIKGSRCVSTNNLQGQVVTCPALDLGETLPNPEHGFNVDRAEFDYWLCKESGALLVDNCLFVDCKQNGHDISVRVNHEDSYCKIKTKFLIGADGPISRVRRSLFPDLDKTLNWIALYEEHYEATIDLEPEWQYWILDPVTFGSFSHKDNILHLNATASRAETAKKTLSRFVEFLQERHGLKIGKTTMKRGIVMNDMPYRESYCLGNGNILLVGEAAGFVRALDGITSALVTGKAAGESVLKSLQSGLTPLQHYGEHSLVQAEWKICKEVQPRLGELGFVFG